MKIRLSQADGGSTRVAGSGGPPLQKRGNQLFLNAFHVPG
jgi:hypothetical protein